jgi:hypothetical protein
MPDEKIAKVEAQIKDAGDLASFFSGLGGIGSLFGPSFAIMRCGP